MYHEILLPYASLCAEFLLYGTLISALSQLYGWLAFLVGETSCQVLLPLVTLEKGVPQYNADMATSLCQLFYRENTIMVLVSNLVVYLLVIKMILSQVLVHRRQVCNLQSFVIGTKTERCLG